MQKHYQFEIFHDVNLHTLPEMKEYLVQQKGKEFQFKQDVCVSNKSSTWSKREIEGKNLDNRLLFAINKKAEFDKWILLLNWLVDMIRQEQNNNKFS